jgi:hypothetical protein
MPDVSRLESIIFFLELNTATRRRHIGTQTRLSYA